MIKRMIAKSNQVFLTNLTRLLERSGG